MLKSELLYAECSCGWKYRGIDESEMEHLSLSHDPGSSCCGCGGMLCTQCVSNLPHEECTWDCTDCCLTDSDGYTNMDRQRSTAHWLTEGSSSADELNDFPSIDPRGFLAAFAAGHPATTGREEELFAYLHSIIDTYNKKTHSL